MLSKAEAKISDLNIPVTVDYKQAILPKIPYDDNCFDAVMINQVCLEYFR